MRYPAFAYSGAMQVILFFVTCLTTFVAYYGIISVMLAFYGEVASLGRKLLFTFLIGTVLNNFWIYGVYLLGGQAHFPPIVYSLTIIPNPIFALIFYYLGGKVLGLMPHRSIPLMFCVYIYCIVIKCLQQAIGQVFFMQQHGPYNYLLDAISLCSTMVFNTLSYLLVLHWQRRSGFVLNPAEGVFLRPLWFDLLYEFLFASGVYAVVTFFPLLSGHQDPYLWLLLFGVSLSTLAIRMLLSFKRYATVALENKRAHIAALTGIIENFRALKHDYNNILQAYSGYIALGDVPQIERYHKSVLSTMLAASGQVDISGKGAQNPVLIAVLTQKCELAATRDVTLRIDIACDISNLCLRDIDLIRVVTNLLDNAIDAAAESPRRTVLFSAEPGTDKSLLLVISNSTAGEIDLSAIMVTGYTSKAGHMGYGVPQVRQILGRYRNCSLHFSYFDNEFFAYISIRPLT